MCNSMHTASKCADKRSAWKAEASGEEIGPDSMATKVQQTLRTSLASDSRSPNPLSVNL